MQSRQVRSANSSNSHPQLSAREILCPVPPLSRQAARRWIIAGNDELPELLSAAREARSRFRPGSITYSRKVFLPLTNLCRDYCGYCTFRRDVGQPGAHTMSLEELLAVCHAGAR